MPALIRSLLLVVLFVCSFAACSPGDGSDTAPPAKDASADGQICGDACDASGDGGESGADAGPCGADGSACECQADADCAKLDDGNPCNGNLYCHVASHTCKANPATVIDCPTTTAPCVAVVCDPADGQCRPQPADEGQACDDGESCTTGDVCADGQCAGKSTCTCKKDADCKPFDDDDACNGKLYCDTSSGNCKLNPGSVTKCGTWADGPCALTACDPSNGKCGKKAKTDGTACEVDGLACTKDACKDGTCAAGTPDSSCDCSKQADCAPLEDDNVCNGTLYCNLALGKCELNPASTVSCPTIDDGACQAATCNKKTGDCSLVAAVDGASCDDGNPCSGSSACQGGVCEGSDPVCMCTAPGECADKALTNACLGKLYCDLNEGWCKLNTAAATICKGDDDTACLANLCDPQDGLCKLTALTDGQPCEADGTWCTGIDTCSAGTCGAGDNACTCQLDADCAKYEDGDACNGTLYCDKYSGKCAVNPATTVTCTSDGDGCAPQTCDPADGTCKAKAVADDTPCDTDLTPCTVERCKSGTCTVKTNKCLCPKGDLCTAWDDGNPCNGTLYCDKTLEPPACVVNPATVITCAKGTPGACTSPKCDPKDGTCKDTAANDGLACVDDNICTLSEACEGGACVQPAGGDVLSCDDINPCTGDACVKGKGCTYTMLTGPCDDGDPCSTGETCNNGGCTADVKTEAVLEMKQGLVPADEGSQVVMAQVVGDPALDMVLLGRKKTAQDNEQTLWIAAGDGKGSFDIGQEVWTEDKCTLNPDGYPLAVADLQGDGKADFLWTRGLDLVNCSAKGAPFAWAWRGELSQAKVPAVIPQPLVSANATTEKLSRFAPMAMTTGDLLAGGNLEVAVFGSATDTNKKITYRLVVMAHKSGDWQVHQHITVKGAAAKDDKPMRLSAVDLDGDKDLDLLATAVLPFEWKWTARVFLNDAGTFTETDLGVVGTFTAADMDTDGKDDLVWQSTVDKGESALGLPILWRRNEGGSKWLLQGATKVLVPTSALPFALLGVGQVNGDKLPDLLGTTETQALMWPGDGEASVTDKPAVLGIWSLEISSTIVDLLGTGNDTLILAGEGMMAWYAMYTGHCVDGNACTTDACKGGKCEHVPNAAFCDDGDACTENGGCKGGKCDPGTTKPCDDKNLCTVDSCDKSDGCAYKPSNGTACDDGEPCTVKDVCENGSCAPGNPMANESPCGGGKKCQNGQCS